MGFDAEAVRLSQEIFYYLLCHHELSEQKESGLFNAYAAEEAVQQLVKSQGAAASCRIERYGDVIYLIPDEDNYFLGFSRSALKAKLCRSGATEKDYYLSQFAILVLLREFYDGRGRTSKIRQFMRLGELMNSISSCLAEGCEHFNEDEQEAHGIQFQDMQEAYEALRSDDTGKRPKTTKEGFLHGILRFLEDQGLLIYVEKDETIMATEKLDRFMDWNILNDSNYARIERIFEEALNGED